MLESNVQNKRPVWVNKGWAADHIDSCLGSYLPTEEGWGGKAPQREAGIRELALAALLDGAAACCKKADCSDSGHI